jgi:hypothetical protein
MTTGLPSTCPVSRLRSDEMLGGIPCAVVLVGYAWWAPIVLAELYSIQAAAYR